jgi:hypothetical protein
VAAHLQPIAIGADVVGMVDHPGREPEQLFLERMQHGDMIGRDGGDGFSLMGHGVLSLEDAI